MHCANFPRHLGRLITRCLIAHPDGADTIELTHWSYGEGSTAVCAPQRVRRHCLSFGIPRVGKRSSRFTAVEKKRSLYVTHGVYGATKHPSPHCPPHR